MADEELAQPLPLPPDMTNAPPLPSGVPASPDQVQAQTAEAQPAAIPPPRPPGTSVLAQQAPTKGEIFRNMLGDFLYSAGKGLAAAGHGPEANARGAGAAITAVPERNIQQQLIGIEQQKAASEAALKQAQAQQYADTVMTPYGPMNAVLAGKVFPAAIRAQGQENVANTNVAGRQKVAETNVAGREKVAEAKNQNNLDVKALQVQVMAGQVSKIMPAMVNGKLGMEAFNKFGESIGVVDGALPPAAYLPKYSSSVQVKQNAEGGYDFVPTPKSSGVMLPGSVSNPDATMPKGGGGGGGARPVMMAGGGGEMSAPASMQARSRAAAADSVLSMIPRIRELVTEHANDLGPLIGRYEKGAFKVGKASGPWVNELNGALTSMYSLAGSMHGWRALQVAEEFKKAYGGLEQDPKNFMGSLKAMEDTANAVVKSGTTRLGGPNKGGGSSADPVQSLIDKYKPK
jgi:hypothetical protein